MFLFVKTQLALYTNQKESTTHLEAKAALGQLAFGLIQPLAFVPFSAFMFATRHLTVRIPSPWNQPKKFLRYWWSLYRPFRGHVIANATIQVLVVMYIVKMQDKQFKSLAESLFVNADNDE